MASYQAQILPAPPQYGFIPGFSAGLAGGAEKAANVYGQAAIKDIFAKREAKKKQEALNKFEEAMRKDPTMQRESISIDESGIPRTTWKRRETPQDIFAKDPQKFIRNAIGGIGTEEAGKLFGIPKQEPMMSLLSGGEGDIYGQPVEDYEQKTKNMLMSQFAPGYTPEQVQRDIMGLPIETPEEKLLTESNRIPQSFSDDIQQLKSIAKNNADVFVSGLEKLSLKYTDNQDVLQRIKLIRSIFSGEQPFVPDTTLQP